MTGFYILGNMAVYGLAMFLILVIVAYWKQLTDLFAWIRLWWATRKHCPVDWLDDHDWRTCSYCIFRRKNSPLPEARLLGDMVRHQGDKHATDSTVHVRSGPKTG